MLERLIKVGVILIVDKFIFSIFKIKFLGNVVSVDSIEVDLDKVVVVVNLLVFKNVYEVYVFLGMVNYMGKFVDYLVDKIKFI